MSQWHTEWRPYASGPVPDALLDALRAAAEDHGAHLHLLRADEVVLLAATASVGSETDTDTDSRYAILFTDADDPFAWLAAGEALSAILLTAAAEMYAIAVMTDVVEVPATRDLDRQALSGNGHPVLALRIGRPAGDGTAAAWTLQRSFDEAVQTG
jgi:uncharacterized protein YciI